MTKLKQCPKCNCKFMTIGNLSKHRAKKHPLSFRASISRGLRNSHNTPSNKVKLQQKAIKESLEFLASVSTAVLTKNPIVALDAVKQGIDVLKAVQDLR